MSTPRIADIDFVAVRDLVKHYKVAGGARVRSVDGVSFTIRQGEVLGLVGESGCGKSTVARLLMRLLQPTGGSVHIDGRDVLALRGEELRRMRRSMQLVFQDPFAALDPMMTIGRSMTAPLSAHGLVQPAGRKDAVLRMLREVGLTDAFYDRFPRECSGGQLQRVGIGRALLVQPEFLVCDEPTSALDASMRTQILNLLSCLRLSLNLTILMISHDLRLVSRFCDRIAVMYLGRIVEIASASELFARPRHPYTRALIASSMLEEHGLDEAAFTLSGEPPSPLNPPSGCGLRTRCAFADDLCSRAVPDLRESDGEGGPHLARCHHLERIGNLAPAPS